MSQRKIGVVIHAPLRDELFSDQDKARLDALGEVVWTDAAEPLSTEAACALLEACEVGVGSWRTPYPGPELLAACPLLKLWEHAAGTVKHMFGPHLAGRDLKIASCKTAIADNVAEWALGEIILGRRRVFENAAANRTGTAGRPAHAKIMFGATIGVVGASEVGKRVMGLLRPFGCRVLLYDPFVSAAQAAEMEVELVSELLPLCVSSDVVTLHTPDLPSTQRLLGAREFGAMRDDAIFINTARGACIDEAALIAELEKGRLFAFIDVSTPEPAANDSPLRRLPNVVYTSHLSGGPGRNLGKQAVDDIAAYLQGGSPLCVVTADSLEFTA